MALCRLSGVRFYHACLSVAQVTAAAAETKPPKPPPPPPAPPTTAAIYRGPILLAYDPSLQATNDPSYALRQLHADVQAALGSHVTARSAAALAAIGTFASSPATVQVLLEDPRCRPQIAAIRTALQSLYANAMANAAAAQQPCRAAQLEHDGSAPSP